jgi:hypothetical protein
MTFLNPGTDDAEILANADRLAKAGVPAPNPDSPAGRRLVGAAERERTGFGNNASVLKSQIVRGGLGSSSELHQRTAEEALARGDRAWTAVDRLTNSRGLMGGETPPTDEKPPEFDPRNPDAYYQAEAVDQLVRQQIASNMAKAGNERMLAHLRLSETARRDPLIAAAVTRAERKAAKKGRKPTEKDFRKAYRKLTAGRGHSPVAKGAGGGLVGNVVDLRVPGVGR